jgi:site-specific recombinase XerD
MAQAVYALRSFYRFLELGDQVVFSPPRQVLTPKIAKRLQHALSVEEFEQVLAAADTPRNLALLELAFASGLPQPQGMPINGGMDIRFVQALTQQ